MRTNSAADLDAKADFDNPLATDRGLLASHRDHKPDIAKDLTFGGDKSQKNNKSYI